MSRSIYLPPPVAYEGDDACRLCSGAKVTGMQLAMPITGEWGERGPVTIICDMLCPACQGCGRGPRHIGCDPIEHADWDPVDQLDDDDQGAACPSCGGRRWNAALAFTEPANRVSYHMRVPCGCAESLMIEAS